MVVTFDPAAADTTILAATSCDQSQVGTTQNLLVGVDGCDSLIITNTTLLPPSTTNLTAKTCNPANTGTFTQTLTNQFGCDSTIITVVTFDPAAADTTILAATSCDQSQVGTTQNLLVGVDGCDSLIITNTTLLPPSTTNLTAKTCNPANTGTFIQTLTNQFGCDSTVITVVTFDPAAADTTILAATSCDQSQVGTTQNLLVGVDGCDSLIITNTTLLPASTTNLTAKTCNPANVGTFTQMLTNQFGCDSTVITVVTFDPAAADTTILAATTCDPGQVGSVQVLFNGPNGCDSLVITNTTLLPGTSTNLTAKTCNPANVGTFTQLLTNQFGCDSTVITVVTFDPMAVDTTILSATTCDPSEVGSIQNLLTGADGCDSLVITTTVIDPSLCAVSAALITTGVSCSKNADGKVTVTVSAGQVPLNFQWTAGTGTTGTGQIADLNTSVIIDSLPAGTFTITITSSIGATTVLNAEIGTPPSIMVQAEAALIYSGFALRCAGSSDGSAHVSATGGLTPYQFLWSNGDTTATISNIAAGVYQVTATDQKGCTNQASVSLVEPAPLDFTLQISPTDCGETTADATIIASGGAGPYTAKVDSVSVAGLMPTVAVGPHIVQLTDANGCTTDTTLTIDLPPVPMLTLPSDTSIHLGQSLTIEAFTNLNNWRSIVWQPNAPDSSCTNCLQQTWMPLTSRRYTVTIIDSFGCAATASIRVLVSREPEIYVPNIFAPDCNCPNDIFQISVGPSVADLSVFQIFDRWGEMVYSWDETIPARMWPGWDGKVGGKKVEVGVYVYYLKVKLVDGEEILLKGDITLYK